ncbi:MAG TPA: UbiA family prenyltransferase [Aggregatilineales bacterium]|nr:UbiA family prenyltransferase [Anaerolineales bacterium]HRE48944.1 UbiA family prenyltransferase [Aggregatilineales bacterium]
MSVIIIRQPAPLIVLFTNHADAWGVTFILSSVCIWLGGGFSLGGLLLAGNIAATAWFTFALNDLFDAPSDAADEAKRQRNAFIGRASAWWVRGGMGVVGMGIGLLFARYGQQGMAIFAGALLIGWAYSAPPIRLKRRPGLDLLTHALGVQTLPYVATLLLCGRGVIGADIAMIGVLVLNSLGAQIEQQLRDYEVDRRTEGNFTIWVGRARARRVLYAATVGIGLIALWHASQGMFPAYLAPFALAGLPLLLHRFTRSLETPRSEGGVRVAVGIALLYAAGVWVVLSRM